MRFRENVQLEQTILVYEAYILPGFAILLHNLLGNVCTVDGVIVAHSDDLP